MALPGTDPASRVLRLIDKAEPRFRRAFLSAVTEAKGLLDFEALARLLEAGRMQEALDAVSRVISQRLAQAEADTFVIAGNSASNKIGDILEVTVAFDQVNQRAVNVMQQERLRLIREFTSEQRRATRTALVDGIQRGINPRQQAKAFRQSIGLTQRQQQAAINYRRLLEQNSLEALTRELRDKRFDSTVRTAARTGDALSPAQIERMYDRYVQRSIKSRSETIARTEALRAVNLGNEEAYDQAIQEGLIDREQLLRTWVSARDKRVRDSHVFLNGLERLKGETFPGAESAIRFPGDPEAAGAETIQCRCALSTRIGTPL